MNIRGDELLTQYRAGAQLWPIITDVEREFDLPPFLLWAEASRETNMRREYAEGKVHNDGHGWGLFGADDRWNTLDLPHFASDPDEQARLAARTLRANFRRLGNWLDAVNAYGPAAGRPTYGQDVLERAAYLATHVGGPTPMPKIVTRAEWGARSADTSTNITPDGVAVHWEGPHMGAFPHSACAGKVRGIQAFHMDERGWDDIAYSAMVCPHGSVFEGRGAGHRTAANGTNDGNQRYYAVCFLGGEGDAFTDEAKQGINEAIDWLGGGRVVGHRDLTETACPGDAIYAWVRAGHPWPASPAPPPHPVQEDDMRIVNVGSGRGIFLVRGDRNQTQQITHPDHVAALVKVGVPYAADAELPAAVFDQYLAPSR